jgi:hypothetical protein
MTAVEVETWTGPQLAAQLASLDGVAPEPVCYVVFRVTRRADGSEQSAYEVPEEARGLDPRDWPKWLQRNGLAGTEQLRVAVLAIHETLDAAGRIVDCTLERRRGGKDGPFAGYPARVEFLGPARAVRLYRATRNHRLQEIAAPAHRGGASGSELPAFLGEQQALERHFGAGVEILDAREPTLMEDMAGLSSVVHLRLADGTECATGVGWHGTMPYFLVADFPRLGVVPELPPPDDAAVRQVLLRQDLVRHETRLDQHGLAVVARARGGEALFLLRSTDGQVRIEPHEPALPASLNEDQRKWLRYAETHEGLSVLECYTESAPGEIVVLTGDREGQAWRHCIDADGVELWRRRADRTAAAALHRERLSPGTLAQSDALAPAESPDDSTPSEDAPPASSLLGLAQTVDRVLTALAEADTADRADVTRRLRRVLADCDRLAAEHSASRLAALLAELNVRELGQPVLRHRLARLQESVRQELALLQASILQPAELRLLHDMAPFGDAVAARFPECAEDIAEAARCLAFRRPTAAVLHCMRVAERGLRASAAQARVALPASVTWAELPALFRAGCPPPVAAALHGLARCWRAPGLVPAAKYTEAEAVAVFQALGAFMREAAAQRDTPPPLPKAGPRSA